jgi:succinate-acetate transporter protein
MQEFLVIGLAGVAVACMVLSVVLIRFGEIIDRFPAGEEVERDRSRWSPREFTRLSVIVFWLLYIPGAWMTLQQSRILKVGGIALVVGLVLFLFTAVIFSMSVLKMMGSRAGRNGISPPEQ